MKDVARAALAVCLALACSEDGERARPQSAIGAVAAAGAGGVAGAGGAASAGAAGAAAGAGGAPASTVSQLRLGDPLELVTGTGDVPYAIGPNPYGIRGGGFLARSALGNSVSVGDTPGEICIRGSLDEVPNGDYSQYWGVEIGFNLNQGAAGSDTPTPAAPTASAAAADAGSDSGDAGPGSDAGSAPAEVARPWLPGDVIGFSFVIEGPTINLIRFKGLPAGYDSSLESSVFCKTIEAGAAAPQTALFSEMTQYCWSSQAVPIPASAGLANISWQLPADVAPAGARPFDWCLKELRPILAP